MNVFLNSGKLKETLLADKKKKRNIEAIPSELVKVERVPLETTEDKSTKEQRLASLVQFIQTGPNYSDLDFTDDEMQGIRRKMSYLATGSTSAIAVICKGAGCPFNADCPFYLVGKVPIGKACILETSLLMEWRRKYIMEYQIDPDSMTELSFINELAEIELMLWRINKNLSKPEYAELVMDEAVGIDREGNVISKKAVSAFLDAKDRLLKQKGKVVKAMVGDRENQYKKQAALREKANNDPSSESADLRRTIRAVIDQAKQLKKTGGQLPVEQTVSPDDLINNLIDLENEEEKKV